MIIYCYDYQEVAQKWKILQSMEPDRFLSVDQHVPKVIINSIIKKPFMPSTIRQTTSKHIFIRVDTELRQLEGMEMLRGSLADETQKDTHFEFVDCLNIKQVSFKRQLVTIFIIPPRILFALKEKLKYYSKNASVVIMCKDEFDVEHQLNNLYLQKITKLISCDPLEILCYVKQQIENCYTSVLNVNSDPGDSKFHFLQFRTTPVNIYYPSKFEQFTKVFQTGAVKRRINYPHLHFYCYNNKKDIVLKDKMKVKTRKFATKEKIPTQNYITNFESRLSISTVNDIETNIVITTRQNEDNMLEYVEERQGYEIVPLCNQEQKTKFLKQFEELFSGVVPEIQIISSEKLTLFLPHSDQELISFTKDISNCPSIEIIQYSSLSVLSTEAYRIAQCEEEFGLILTHCDNQAMMEMMLNMKDIKNIKLIVYPYTKSHVVKSDSSYIFKRSSEREGLFELLKELIEERRQYFSPIETVKHRKVVILIDKRYTQLCQEIIIIVDNSEHVGLKIYEKEETLYELLGTTSSEINYILICKEQRRMIISQYTRQYQNIKYIVLSELIDVEYHPSILQIFTRHTDLLEFISRLCREKEQSDRTPKLQYDQDEKVEQRQQFDLEELIIVPIKEKENKPCIFIYSPNKDYCKNWLVLQQKLRLLDKRIDIFHYNRVIDITKINLNQQPLSIILVTNPNILWAANYSNEFEAGINIVAYSKTPLGKNAMVEQSVNLFTGKLEEVEMFIADAIKYYDSRKVSIITEHDNYEATKLSLQSQMKLSVERKTKPHSNRTHLQYFPLQTFNTDQALPPRIPKHTTNRVKQKEETPQKINENCESSYSEKSDMNIKITSEGEKKVQSQLTPKSNGKPDPVSNVSLSELCMDSRLSAKYRVSQMQQAQQRTSKQQCGKVYILQHKSIQEPIINSQHVITMVYSHFEQLRELYKQLLLDSSCKIIIKLVLESEYCYIPNHPQTTIIKYNTPIHTKHKDRSSSSTAQFHQQHAFHKKDKPDVKRISIFGVSNEDLPLQKSENSTNKLRIHNMSKQKKFIEDIKDRDESENNIISKKNFFAQMFEKQFVYFLLFEQQQHIKKIINANKSSNPRIRIQEYESIDNIMQQFQSFSKQNTHILISSSTDTIITFFKQIKLKQFKSIYVGQEKLPSEIQSYKYHVTINNVPMLNKFIGCIPRFYQSDKLTKDVVSDYNTIHIYFQDYLHASLLVSFLTVCNNNQRLIPHKLQIQELQSARFEIDELAIIVINNKYSSNYQAIKNLNKSENVVVYFYEKEGDEINRLLEILNHGRKVDKMNIKPKNIEKQLLSIEFSRTVRPDTQSEASESSNSLQQTYKQPSSSNKNKTPKQLYADYFQELDQTAYIFENRQILDKVCDTSKTDKLNVIVPDKQYEQVVDFLSHIKSIAFMTYNTAKILADTLKHQNRNVVLLNEAVVKGFRELQEKFGYHVFVTYEEFKSQNHINLHKVKDLMKFGVLLEMAIKYKEKKSKLKPKNKKSKVEKINIFYKYPKDYTLKQSLEKLSNKIKCVAYESVKGLLSQLQFLDLKNSYNIIVERDNDIFELEESIDYNEFKLIRMMSGEFQDENNLDVNENVLIEATKYSTISDCVKKVMVNLFGSKGDDEQTVRRKGKQKQTGKG